MDSGVKPGQALPRTNWTSSPTVRRLCVRSSSSGSSACSGSACPADVRSAASLLSPAVESGLRARSVCAETAAWLRGDVSGRGGTSLSIRQLLAQQGNLCLCRDTSFSTSAAPQPSPAPASTPVSSSAPSSAPSARLPRPKRPPRQRLPQCEPPVRRLLDRTLLKLVVISYPNQRLVLDNYE